MGLQLLRGMIFQSIQLLLAILSPSALYHNRLLLEAKESMERKVSSQYMLQRHASMNQDC
jgi:hypothetical protein